MALKPLGKTTAPKPKKKKPIYNPSMSLQGTAEGKRYLKRIREMTSYERLIYWISERHAIHCKRFGLKASIIGKPSWSEDFDPPANHSEPPWTQDPILQTIFFCNPYRENDKVTAYLRDNFRDEFKAKPQAFLGTICLRMFNHIPTMRLLINAGIPQRLGTSPKESTKALVEMKKILVPLRDKGEQIFGGAYIIIFRPGERKVERAYEAMCGLAEVYHKEEFCHQQSKPTFANCYEQLISFEGIGQFYTYQYLGDLAYTHVLAKAPDWWTWGYCGPGTARGLYRLKGITEINGVPLERRCPAPKDAYEQLEELRTKVNKDLAKLKLPKMHNRDLCNCLCEYDKYNRALNNERHVKRPYSGR